MDPHYQGPFLFKKYFLDKLSICYLNIPIVSSVSCRISSWNLPLGTMEVENVLHIVFLKGRQDHRYHTCCTKELWVTTRHSYLYACPEIVVRQCNNSNN